MSALHASSESAAPLPSGPTTTSASLGQTTTNGTKQRLSDLDTTKGGSTGSTMADTGVATAASIKPLPNVTSAPRTAASPGSASPAPGAPLASPTQIYQSGSPRIQSPASSQIFERNVQETASISGELSPAIPSHIQTEDHIPAVLEASSLAITDGHLDPDEVEIVTHIAHQPAAAVVASSLSDPLVSPSSPQVFEDLAASQTGSAFQPEGEDTQSTYGSIDTTDIRRLSFISFADVVHAENAETNRDSVHLASLSSTAANRSPSPVRSPTSSHGFNVSPPTSGATSIKGLDNSTTLPPAAVPLAPVMGGIRTPGSPTTSQSPLGGGEIAIETMRQALRKTGSGDLSSARSPSQPLSAVSIEEGNADVPPFR